MVALQWRNTYQCPYIWNRQQSWPLIELHGRRRSSYISVTLKTLVLVKAVYPYYYFFLKVILYFSTISLNSLFVTPTPSKPPWVPPSTSHAKLEIGWNRNPNPNSYSDPNSVIIMRTAEFMTFRFHTRQTHMPRSSWPLRSAHPQCMRPQRTLKTNPVQI